MLTAAGVLNRALKTLVHIVPKRSTFPTLESVLIEPADGGVAITATDLTAEARIVVPATDAFPTCLPARPLLEFVASLDRDAAVMLAQHGDTVRVAAAGATIDLPQRPPSEFPKTLAHTGTVNAVKDPDAFLEGLSWVARAVGNDETRPQLMGVLLDGDASVGCDGHRLHRVVTTGLGCPKALVPANAIALVLRALKGQPIEINVGKTTARFRSPSCAITTRLIDALYPTYAQVIPMASGASFSMKVGAVDLSAGLKRVCGRASRRSDKTMKLSANGAIKLETSGDDVQRAVTVGVLETTHQGDDHVQGFNPWYLQEALADLDAVASLRFYDAEGPLLIEAGERTAVVMPCRL